MIYPAYSSPATTGNQQARTRTGNSAPMNRFCDDSTRPPMDTGQNGRGNGVSQQLVSLLSTLLQQLLQQLQGSGSTNPNSTPIQFDASYPQPLTHLSPNEPLQTITYSKNGYQASTAISPTTGQGQGTGLIVEGNNVDIRPHINGQAVVRIDYANTQATYTLENGTTLTGNKPAYAVPT